MILYKKKVFIGYRALGMTILQKQGKDILKTHEL